VSHYLIVVLTAERLVMTTVQDYSRRQKEAVVGLRSTELVTRYPMLKQGRMVCHWIRSLMTEVVGVVEPLNLYVLVLEEWGVRSIRWERMDALLLLQQMSELSDRERVNTTWRLT
jgi:hypothetical protein